MILGIPTEIMDQEYRVAMTPGGVKALRDVGHRVLVQKGAGLGSGFSDASYRAAGGEIVADAAGAWSAEMVVKVKEPQPAEFGLMSPGLLLFAFLHLAADEILTQEMLKRAITGVAYETVEPSPGELPLLKPMSEIAGRIAVQVGARYLERGNGGKGKLLSGVAGVEPAHVVVIGSGTVGSNAVRIAAGMGARVTVISTVIEQLRHLEDIVRGRVVTLSADPVHIGEAAASADLLIGAVLVPGARAPKVVTKGMVAAMEPGSVIVDVSVDQGGCIETTRPTSHSHPIYLESGVIHYAVTNIPGAVPRTGTQALVSATLPYVMELAAKGIDGIEPGSALAKGVNTHQGRLTHQAVAEAFGMEFAPFGGMGSSF
jgi:alanine dehydrogenase